MVAAEEKLPSSYSSVTLDKAYFQTDRPAEEFHVQNNVSGNCDQPIPDLAATGNLTYASATESGEQLHQADFPGNHPHRTYLPGDPDKARITSVPLTDSKSDDPLSFPEDQSGKTNMPTVSFMEQDQCQLHFYSRDQPPSYLGAGVDKPHHHPSELADKSPTPSNLPRDKSYPPSGSPEENPSTAAMAYMTAAPATAEMSTREASWDVAEQATAADFATATLQRPPRTNRPLPPPPSQRSGEQLPVVGQVQTAASVGLNNSHKVRRGGSWGDEMYFFQRYVTFQQGVLFPLSQIGHLSEVLWQFP